MPALTNKEQTTLPNYLKLLHSRSTHSEKLDQLHKSLQTCCQMGERHLLKQKKSSSFVENPVSFLNQFVDWMHAVSDHIGFSGFEVNMGAGIQDANGRNEICMWSTILVVDVCYIFFI